MQRRLPTGTVTILFTDIEGSTRLLQELGARSTRGAGGAPAVAAEAFGDTAASRWTRRATRSSSRSRRRRRARAAAAATARAATAHPVRMGRTPARRSLTEEGYVGEDVHRAARIAAAGHGGQVLVSTRPRARRPRGCATWASTGSRT